MLITTVYDNKSKLSAHAFSRAKTVRALQLRIGRPVTKDVIHYMTANLIPNCPVTVNDIKNAKLIVGPDIESLKGKTPRQPSPQI